MAERVLLVDDQTQVLEDLREVLRGHGQQWQLHFASSVEDALALTGQLAFDTIVSSISLPGGDGLDLLRALRENPEHSAIPVIALAGDSGPAQKQKALDLGATGFLYQPIDAFDLTARLRSSLRVKALQDDLTGHNKHFEQVVKDRGARLRAARLDLIWRLAKAGEFRDEGTGHHVVRVGFHAKVIAEQMDQPTDFVDNVLFTAPLHDIGKIGIPDSILLKPGNLTHEQWKKMRVHTVLGAAILGAGSTIGEAFRLCGVDLPDMDNDNLDNPILETASRIALNHHERWDGRGYPHGLRGEEIPLEARVTSIADVYDALRSRRPYKDPMSEAQTLAYIANASGSHFDPKVHDAFLESLPKARKTLRLFADENYVPDGEISEVLQV